MLDTPFRWFTLVTPLCHVTLTTTGVFTGDLDLDLFPNDSDRFLLALFIFLVVIVLLNVLVRKMRSQAETACL